MGARHGSDLGEGGREEPAENFKTSGKRGIGGREAGPSTSCAKKINGGDVWEE